MNDPFLSRLTAAVVATALLSGCSTYSPIIGLEPGIGLQESFSDTGVEAPDQWWEDFEDSNLTRLVEATLEDNLSPRMAWSRLDQMRAVARAAGAGRNPTADMPGSGERQKRGGDQSVSPFDPQDDTVNTMLAGLTVGYQVDLWEKISNSRKAFLLDQQSSRQDVESTALALTASASELWYGIAAEQATGFGAACRQLPGRNALSGGARS